MNHLGRHLSEEEWIEYYYGESADPVWAQEHILSCAECAAMGRELSADLAGLRADPAEPKREREYGEQVWHGLRTRLAPYPRSERTARRWEWIQRWHAGLGLKLAGAAVALAAMVLGAFYAGQRWEQQKAPRTAAVNPAQAEQRIILLVVGDHLDRTQKLLAELEDPEAAVADHGLQTTARRLLTENRLYRATSRRGAAGHAGDDSIQAILDELEPVLVELAHQPGDLSREDVIRLRKELHTGGLLFEIRVLRSKVGAEERNQNGLPGGTA